MANATKTDDKQTGIDLTGSKTGPAANGQGKKEAKPTRYVILYRVDGDREHVYREALKPGPLAPDDLRERLVIESSGQNDARAQFLDLCRSANGEFWTNEGEPVQIAAIPFSSWDPKSPRRKVTTLWD